MRRITFAIFAAFLSCSMASAQNWRQPNPDQPNGYHASEAASHYHGDLHMPAQPQNGYHASEARSHYGGSRMEPSSGWGSSESSGGGRWGESSSSSRWGGSDQSSSGWGSRWGGSEQSSGWGQTTPAEQTFARGVLRRTMMERYAASQGQANVGQPDPGIRYSATNGLLGGRMANVENSASQMIRNGGGFNTIYAPESGR